MELLEKDIQQWFEELQDSAEQLNSYVRMFRIDIDYSRPYQEAMKAAGRATCAALNDPKDRNKRYQHPEIGVISETLVLFGRFDGYARYQESVKWALEQDLRLTSLYALFAVGEHYPRLNYELGMDIDIYETTGFSTCENSGFAHISWGTSKKNDVYISLLGDPCYLFDHLGTAWFLFRK